MDILRFINSKDIRAHLERIGYKFDPLKAAWLIYQCRNATIAEKHAAWNELIEKMPDRKIEARRNTVPQESLHAFLKLYMALEDKYIADFCDEKHADAFDDDKPFVYKYRFTCGDGTRYDSDTVFSRFGVLQDFEAEPWEDVVSVECTKMQIDKPDKYPNAAYLTPSFDILRIDPGHIDDDDERDIYWGVFDGMWFDFPTPFKKGDIVWNPNKPKESCEGGPFVVTAVCLEGIKSSKAKENCRKNGDFSDMCADGFFLNKDGSIYGETVWNYMDLEFYDKELSGTEKTLIALRNFIKGSIDPALFARAYHRIITAGYADESTPRDYTECGLRLAGLSEPEHIKIWLDDIREAPEGYFHCHSVNEAVKKIVKCEEEHTVIDVIDCDHDLGDYARDGGDGIKLIDWLAERGTHYPIALHTMNPVGRENMQREIDRYWK